VNGPALVLLRVATAVIVTVVALLVLAWALQRRLIYLPTTAPVPAVDGLLPGGEEVSFDTEDGLRLRGWFVSGGAGAAGPTVLVFNGNAGNRSDRAPLAGALARAGMSVLLFDYRGYGGNPGSPSESGLARDARAARRFLVEEAAVPRERLVYFGESLGTAVVTELAKEHPPAGLVLRSPFVDLGSVGRVHYPFLPVGRLLLDGFPLAEHLARVNVPTTVIYGTRDSIIPPAQSLAVAEAAAGPTRVVAVDGADHNDPELLDGPEPITAVCELAKRIGRHLG
jgi:uncharacterized protein